MQSYEDKGRVSLIKNCHIFHHNSYHLILTDNTIHNTKVDFDEIIWGHIWTAMKKATRFAKWILFKESTNFGSNDDSDFILYNILKNNKTKLHKIILNVEIFFNIKILRIY